MHRRRRREYKAMADINIANLVDVVLVLLIIFMISAPLLQSGIEVNLPKTTAAPIKNEVQGVVITLDAKGGMYVNDKWTRLDQLETAVKDAMKAKATEAVYVRGDSTVVYGVAINVIGRLKQMGVEQIGLVTSPADGKSKTKR